MTLAEFYHRFRSYQVEIKDWLREVVGIPEQYDSIENRSQRFLEESLELVQVTGLTKEQCHTLVDYVYGRPTGDLPQEVGGSMVCLAVLCERLNINAAQEMVKEIVRVHQPEMIEKVRNAIERKRNDGVGI